MHGEQSLLPTARFSVLSLFTVRTQRCLQTHPTSLAWTMALVSQSLGPELLENTQNVGSTSLPGQGMAARHLNKISAYREINQADELLAVLAASSA